MNKPVQAMFRVGSDPPEGLFIRALPLYAVAGHISQPVTRCPNHASPEDSSNTGFPVVSIYTEILYYLLEYLFYYQNNQLRYRTLTPIGF